MTSKEEWWSIIDQEEGQKLAIQIIEEVLGRSQTVIFQRRIESQALGLFEDQVGSVLGLTNAPLVSALQALGNRTVALNQCV